MYFLKPLFGGHDWVLNITCLFLFCIGLLSLFSTSTPQFEKQIIWICIGIIVFIITSSIDYRIFSVHSFPAVALYSASVIGVMAVYIVGITSQGSGRWIDFGFFWVEPVESLKIALILILSKYFYQRHIAMHRLRNLLIPGVYLLLPGLLVFSHPDLGSFIVLTAIWFGVLFVAGIKLKHTVAIFIIGSLFAIFSWFFLLYDYQKTRILSFLDPLGDPLGSNYNVIQSIIATSSGGLWGKGLGGGTQSQLGFLPEASTDFIYAAIIEEMGIIVGIFILVLFGILLWRLFKISTSTQNDFARLAISGIMFMLCVQIFINIGTVIGLLPVTGLTLPLISYGGSSVVTICAALGLAQSVNRHTKKSQHSSFID